MTQDTPSRSLDKVIVRLPDGMRDQIKAHAEANNRSMNAEIVSLLSVAMFEADIARMSQG
ncbi:Arc family DNA-binding protein, partial [Ochrobactrum sp. SFR4]|uniref:Arc family DNA-binding protein n=1 Tax=Ochrobactrum sp. SFR4 TaxID=2717368 RepID=UPI001C8CA32C